MSPEQALIIIKNLLPSDNELGKEALATIEAYYNIMEAGLRGGVHR